ncbi:hypothetical protein BHE74_00037989 [Ensete ventricosum]|nr:hypothetical protein GW17_00011809 [Ensete ventricosum]RWW55382.1 hypothetical protein BHE74_00037989 [Ensete ventricosum]RZS11000.1 hypothetical protein BHM03_00042282 [Ensete ventricosum]
MKMDEARAGIKVFNGKESHRNAEQGGERGCRRLRRNQSDSVTPCTPSKENALIERSAVRKIRKASSDLSNSPKTSTKQEQVLLLGDGNKGDGGEGKVADEIEIEMEGDESFVDKKLDQPEEKPTSVREQEEEEDEVNYENQEVPVPSQDAEKDQLPVSVSSMNVEERKQNPVTEHKALNPDPAVLPHRKLGETMGSDERDERYMVGEEEAIWLLKLLLPYVNELLLKLRSLFSGDPATTLKVRLWFCFQYQYLLHVASQTKMSNVSHLAVAVGSAVVCDGKVRKLHHNLESEVNDLAWYKCMQGFLCVLDCRGTECMRERAHSHAVQLLTHCCAWYGVGKFWLERLSDGWESCTHKKAVATAIFALIWNISSTVARIWAFFMVVVAVKLYQQCATEHRWCGQEEEGQEDSVAGQSQGLGSHPHRGWNAVKKEEKKGIKVGDPRGGVGKRSK